MKLGSNTVLITGGATGIGLAIAQRFHEAGSKVIVCGRRADKLRETSERLRGIETRVCDIAKAGDRVTLRDWAVRAFPRLNVLINNAGIQRKVSLIEDDPEDWRVTAEEIAINLEAPIHLARLFVPHLRSLVGTPKGDSRPTIINVTSGLSFTPLANVPVYCATKAALHSFTLSLRHQLFESGIDVVEIAPPAVDTDLGGAGLHTFGEPVDAFADAVMARVAAGEQEVGYGFSEKARLASRGELDELFKRMNRPVSE